MKLFFSLIVLLIIQTANSTEVILLSHSGKSQNIQVVKKLLREKFYIPYNLITEEQKSVPCQMKSEAIIHLCFDEKDEMKILYVNQKVMKEVLGVFYEDTK